ncbi:AraC family transcriptional regulator [Sphingobacterium faecium]|uniref:AraC family transcriptional regulator n=1 Tax=Sphingobacterium faecium TaxID=34087 RepID=UPI002468E6AD|nr:AraC family transcriptional regulator [Sphingobacterium faecium]MDH5825981.1 AraC family transcriptional regulator [Sphingobacterium faecium]
MKPVPAKILEGKENEVYDTKIVNSPYFSTLFHFHEECQLNYVVESNGTRMIGDSIESFSHDDLILVGSNIPHVWHNSAEYFVTSENENQAKSITLFFHPEKVISMLSQLGDVKELSDFFQRSRRCIRFRGNTKSQIKILLIQLAEEVDVLIRLGLLTKIFHILCKTKEYDVLTGAGYTNTYQLKDNDRMDIILKHIFNNFAKEIPLKDVSDMIYMNKQSFCRYFKSRTQKTFVEFVNEVRIGHACKLLTQVDYRVNDLAYDCGFNSLSNFNKFFKKAKGLTPREYRCKIIASAHKS